MMRISGFIKCAIAFNPRAFCRAYNFHLACGSLRFIMLICVLVGRRRRERERADENFHLNFGWRNELRTMFFANIDAYDATFQIFTPEPESPMQNASRTWVLGNGRFRAQLYTFCSPQFFFARAFSFHNINFFILNFLNMPRNFFHQQLMTITSRKTSRESVSS